MVSLSWSVYPTNFYRNWRARKLVWLLRPFNTKKKHLYFKTQQRASLYPLWPPQKVNSILTYRKVTSSDSRISKVRGGGFNSMRAKFVPNVRSQGRDLVSESGGQTRTEYQTAPKAPRESKALHLRSGVQSLPYDSWWVPGGNAHGRSEVF